MSSGTPAIFSDKKPKCDFANFGYINSIQISPSFRPFLDLKLLQANSAACIGPARVAESCMSGKKIWKDSAMIFVKNLVAPKYANKGHKLYRFLTQAKLAHPKHMKNTP